MLKGEPSEHRTVSLLGDMVGKRTHWHSFPRHVDDGGEVVALTIPGRVFFRIND